MAIVEAKKSDPPSADEVFENIFVGNKAAAEDTQFLLRFSTLFSKEVYRDRKLL